MLLTAGRCALLLALAAAPRPAAADGQLSVGIATGGHLFADDLELGVADAPGQGAPASGVLVGARLGIRLLPRLSVEGELVLIPTTERMTGESIDVLGYRAQAVVDIARGGPFRAFLVSGAGVLDLAASEVPAMQDDTDIALHWGAGAGIALSASLEGRVDARQLILPDVSESGASSDFELCAGLSYLFTP